MKNTSESHTNLIQTAGTGAQDQRTSTPLLSYLLGLGQGHAGVSTQVWFILLLVTYYDFISGRRFSEVELKILLTHVRTRSKICSSKISLGDAKYLCCTKSCALIQFALTAPTILLQVCRKFILGSDDAPETKLPTTEKNIIRPGIPVKIKFSDL